MAISFLGGTREAGSRIKADSMRFLMLSVAFLAMACNAAAQNLAPEVQHQALTIYGQNNR